MNKTQILLGALAVTSLAACSGGAAGPPKQTQVNIAAQSALQFAVGTANINGATGMNVVSTFRQPNGLSATLVSTPTLTGPFSLAGTTPQAAGNAQGATFGKGPSTAEAGGAAAPANCPSIPCITGAPQQIAGTASAALPYQSTFGTSGGVFGDGFAPANYTTTGSPVSYAPFSVPLYGTALFVPWGGPPAYDPNGSGKGTRDGTFSTTLLGVSEGLSVFNGVAAGAGTYTLGVNVPAANGTGATFSSTFAAGAPITLPTIAPPTVTIGAGGTIGVSYVMPAGFVGEYIQIVDTTTAPKTYYTFWRTDAGSTVTVTPAMAPGAPGSTATPAASGDVIVAYVVGFDYNHYALTYNGPLSSTYPQAPALPASADVSISGVGTATAP